MSIHHHYLITITNPFVIRHITFFISSVFQSLTENRKGECHVILTPHPPSILNPVYFNSLYNYYLLLHNYYCLYTFTMCKFVYKVSIDLNDNSHANSSIMFAHRQSQHPFLLLYVIYFH